MRADSQHTVDDLLNVAERLFARNGVEQVALTRIVSASGQKNRSALHYHFGSREGVLAAVLDRRLKHINALRHKALNDASPGGDLARAVRGLVAPLCQVVLSEPWGSDYISILAQVSFHPRLLGERAVDDANLSSVRQCRRLIAEALPTIARPILAMRLKWLTDGVVLATARWSRETSKALRTREAMESLIDEFIDYGTAGLSAPSTVPQTKTSQRKKVRTAAG